MTNLLFLAPLHGYTDYVFRNAFTKHFGGIDVAVTPFVSLVKGKRIKLTHLSDLLPERNQLVTTIPQVIGNDADQFLVMANDLFELGYRSINWNLGCPIKAIARKKRGSGLLPHPELINDILDKVVPHIKQSFSVKIRMGYNDENEIDNIIPVLNRFPLEYVMIHPRIGTQMYEGDLKMDKLKATYEQINTPIVFSGDINSLQDYKNIRQNFPGIKLFMLGRGLLQNLFLAEEIRNTGKRTSDDKRNTLISFVHELTAGLKNRMAREKNVLNKSKEYWFSFRKMFANPDNIFNQIKRIDNLQDFENAVDKIVITEDFTRDIRVFPRSGKI